MSGPLDSIMEYVHRAQLDPLLTTRLATITAVTATTISVQFDGETSASTKRYRVAGVGGAVGDRVVMLRVGSTWVVANKVQSGPAIETTAANFVGGWSTAAPGPTDGSPFVLTGGGRFRGYANVTAFNAANTGIQVRVFIDQVSMGDMRLDPSHPLSAHVALSTLAFDVALGPGTHRVYYQLIVGNSNNADYGSFFGICTPT